MAFAEAGLVFLEGHVQLPVQLVLDAPVTADGFGKAAGGELLAENVVPDFDGLFSVASGLVERHADRGELGPASTIGQVGGSVADVIHPRLFAATMSRAISVWQPIALNRSCDGMPALKSKNFANHFCLVRPQRAMATKSSAPQITAHNAIVTTLISG